MSRFLNKVVLITGNNSKKGQLLYHLLIVFIDDRSKFWNWSSDSQSVGCWGSSPHPDREEWKELDPSGWKVLRRGLEQTQTDTRSHHQQHHPNLLLNNISFCLFLLHLWTGDLDDEEDVKRIVSTSLGYYGRLDVLINNAGIIEMGSIESTSLGQLDRLMRTNVRYCTLL